MFYMHSSFVVNEGIEFRDEILETGRHPRVTTTHHIFQGVKGKKILSEGKITSVVLLTPASNMYHIEMYLSVYCGLPSKQHLKTNDVGS